MNSSWLGLIVSTLSVFAFSLPQPSTAQSIEKTKWTLEECVIYALEHNISVKQNDIRLTISDGTQQGAKGAFLPTVSASVSQNFRFGFNQNPLTGTIQDINTRQTSGGVRVNWLLFNGFARYREMERTKLAYLADRYNLDNIKNDISINVSQAYLDIVQRKERLKIAEEQVRISENLKELADSLTNKGIQPISFLLDAQATLANDELALVQAKNNYNLARLTLMQAMQLPYDQYKGFEIELTVPIVSTERLLLQRNDPEVAYLQSLEVSPSIHSLNYTAQSVEKSIDIAWGRFYPRLDFSYNLGSQFVTNNIQDSDPFSDQISNNLSNSFSFTLSIPIFDQFADYYRVQQSKLNFENAQLNLLQAKNTIRQNIETIINDIIAARETVRANTKNVEAQQTSFKIADKSFKEGLINITDFNVSKSRLVQAQINQVIANYDLIFRVKLLEFYTKKNPYLEQ